MGELGYFPCRGILHSTPWYSNNSVFNLDKRRQPLLVTEVNSQSWQIRRCFLQPDFYLHKIGIVVSPRENVSLLDIPPGRAIPSSRPLCFMLGRKIEFKSFPFYSGELKTVGLELSSTRRMQEVRTCEMSSNRKKKTTSMSLVISDSKLEIQSPDPIWLTLCLSFMYSEFSTISVNLRQLTYLT